MRSLIVAAGQGTRLRERGGLKPLIEIAGAPLIGHVMRRGRDAGVEDFVVVSGYRGDELRREVDRIADRERVTVVHVANDDWRRANGLSVLAARPALRGPFLLTMCDHLIDPSILRDLMSVHAEPGTVTLAVDGRVDNPLNDPEDVTRVRHDASLIRAIGKSLAEFNAIDTGAFLCTDAIFDALETSRKAGDDSISGAMTVLARRGKARMFDIGERLWVDVDDPTAFAKAERLLLDGRL